jgi:hypothetical protein
MATMAQAMSQIAGSSAGSPDMKRFGGSNTAGSISGGTPSVANRRGAARLYAQQEAFKPTTDITGAMQQSDKIMFKPVQIAGMNPTAPMTNAYQGQGAFEGPRLDANVPMPMSARKAIARSPFSHAFSSVFVPEGEGPVDTTITGPTCETHPSMPRCRDDEPPDDDDEPTESGHGEGFDGPDEPEGPDVPGHMMTTSVGTVTSSEPTRSFAGMGGKGGRGKGKGTAPTTGAHHAGKTHGATAPGLTGGHAGGAEDSEGAGHGFGHDDGGEDSEGGEGSKVICGELHRQGLMSDEVYQGDLDYQEKYVDEHTKDGYLLWAIPVSRLMRRSRVMTQVARPFATAWAEEMAYRANGTGSGNVFGAIILLTIAPICTLVGKIAGPRSKKALLPA